MLRNFWRTIAWLAVVTVAFSVLSFAYLSHAGVGLAAPTLRAQLLTLPTSIPSLWNIVYPSTNIAWTKPFVVLTLQVFLTGGFYGTLVRANTGQPAGLSSFVSDSWRSFWRLFLWNALWTGIAILFAGVVDVFPQLNLSLAVAVLVLRYIFMFVDLALVCERSVPNALRSAVAALFTGIVAMLPYGVAISLLTGVLLSLTAQLSAAALLLASVVYVLALTWILHMVTARYLLFSRWQERAGHSA